MSTAPTTTPPPVTAATIAQHLRESAGRIERMGLPDLGASTVTVSIGVHNCPAAEQIADHMGAPIASSEPDETRWVTASIPTHVDRHNAEIHFFAARDVEAVSA